MVSYRNWKYWLERYFLPKKKFYTLTIKNMPKKPLQDRYWTRTVLWKETYHTTPSWRQILMVLCKCDCWTEKFVQRNHLLNWTTKNCWCQKWERFREIAKEHSTKHWMEWTQPYKKFMSAKSRCTNPKNESFYRYGWRWIKFEWKNFEEFRKDMKDSYYEHVKKYWEKNTTIDRINVDWNYCKENCRRATRQEQYENMSNNHKVLYKWKEYPTIAKLCKEKWVNYRLVRDRLQWWRTIEDAVDLPLIPLWKKHVKKGNNIQQTPHIATPPLLKW